ncbi:hypothetical protein AMTRI_Chr02g254040 [Amborella trichopoda]
MASHKASLLLAMRVVLSLLGDNACLAARGLLGTHPLQPCPPPLLC